MERRTRMIFLQEMISNIFRVIRFDMTLAKFHLGERRDGYGVPEDNLEPPNKRGRKKE